MTQVKTGIKSSLTVINVEHSGSNKELSTYDIYCRVEICLSWVCKIVMCIPLPDPYSHDHCHREPPKKNEGYSLRPDESIFIEKTKEDLAH